MAAAAVPPDSYFDRHAVIGPFIVGVMFNTLACGLIVSMAFSYFREYGAADWRAHKVHVVLVAVLAALALTTFGDNVSWLWLVAVEQAPLAEFLTISSQYLVADLATCWTIGLAQAYFGLRLFRLARSYPLLLLNMLVAGHELVSPVVFLILRDDLAPIAGLETTPGLDRLSHYGMILFWISLGNDLIISGSLLAFLLRQKAAVSAQTETLLSRLGRLTLTTAAASCPIQLLAAVSFFVMPSTINYIPFAFESLLQPVFSACVIYTLSARNSIREAAANTGRSPKFTLPSFVASRVHRVAVPFGDGSATTHKPADAARLSTIDGSSVTRSADAYDAEKAGDGEERYELAPTAL